jgi:hypothetical protein
MQLERSCQFYFALKYYFAGIQYFILKTDRKRSCSPADPSTGKQSAELQKRFEALFEKLVPFSNRQVLMQRHAAAAQQSHRRSTLHWQVYEQARATVEYQRGVLSRGTMMK